MTIHRGSQVGDTSSPITYEHIAIQSKLCQHIYLRIDILQHFERAFLDDGCLGMQTFLGKFEQTQVGLRHNRPNSF